MINKNYGTRIIIYISHIYDITFYLRLLNNLKYKQDQVLLIVNPKVESQIGLNISCLKEIGKYITLPCNLNYENGVLKNIISSFRIRKWIKNNFNIDSILITTDKSQFLSLFFISNFRKRILIQQVESIDNKYSLNLKYTLYFNLFHIITGCKLMLYYTMSKSKGQLINLKFFKSIENDIIYHTSSNNVKPKFTLPRLVSNNELSRVIIFGSRYNSWKFVNQIEFKQKLFYCYSKIKKLYDNHKFIYIPHPLERGSEFNEINKLFENQLHIEDNVISSEYYLYKNRNALVTFSIGSTSSQSSFNMGIPSKVLYKCLNFDKNIEEAYDQLFFQFPDSFFINNISKDVDYLVLSSSATSNNHCDLEPFINKLENLKKH